jgi:hypothetical protein
MRAACGFSYISYNNLLKHYRENVAHKPVNVVRKKPITAKDDVDKLFKSNLSDRARRSKVK